jgi:hypothetical protein
MGLGITAWLAPWIRHWMPINLILFQILFGVIQKNKMQLSDEAEEL